jgi:hypothetical protein
MRRSAVLVLALLVAGCSDPDPPSTDGGPEPTAPTGPLAAGATEPTIVAGNGLRLLATPLGDVCLNNCFEPTIVALSTLVAAPGYNGQLVVQTPNGTATRPMPPVPPTRATGTYQTAGDNTLQRAPDGRLYFTRLYLSAAAVAVLVVDGVQVASSMDEGETWDINTYIGLADGIHPDRQWLGFGSDGAVYLSVNHFSQAAPATPFLPGYGILVARSDDGGRTFGPFATAVEHRTRGGYYNNGGRVVDDEGVLRLAFGTWASETRVLAVASSTDRGATWTQAIVDGAPGPTRLMQDDAYEGRFAIAWSDIDGGVRVTSTLDGGATWSPMLLLGNDVAAPPWIEGGPRGFDVTWTNGKGEAVLARIADEAEWQGQKEPAKLVLGSKLPASGSTDFANLAHAPDGRVAVVWADSTAGRLYWAEETN